MLWLLSTVLEEKDAASLERLETDRDDPTGPVLFAQIHAGPAPYSRGSHWNPLFPLWC